MKKILTIIAIMMMAMISRAETAKDVKYIDANGVEQTCAEATIVASVEGHATWSAGWYVVQDSVSITRGATCTGDVHLILADEGKLTISSANYSTGICVGSNNTLQIYGQKEGSGQLYVSAGYDAAGIGGAAKAIVINGGNITAKGGGCAAGIGGEWYDSEYSSTSGYVSSITINGGNINAVSEWRGAGIGSGYWNSCGTITINGGKIIASGGSGRDEQGKGIGAAVMGRCDAVYIKNGLAVYAGSSENPTTWWNNSGGNVNRSLSQEYVVIKNSMDVNYIDANGDTQTCTNAKLVVSSSDHKEWSAGWYAVVGSNVNLSNSVECSGDVHLIIADGAKLTTSATTEGNSGITVGADNTLEIYGQTEGTGKIIATGAKYGAGIGGCAKSIILNGTTITANGGESGAGVGSGYNSSCGEIIINGGTVNATGGSSENGACGVGYGESSSCGNVTINEGTVHATGSGKSPAISSTSSCIVDKRHIIYGGDTENPTTEISNNGTDIKSLLTQKYIIVKPNYLCFTAQSSGTIKFFKTEKTSGTITAALEYCIHTNSPSWTAYTYDTGITLGSGSTIYFRAQDQSGASTFSVDNNNYIKFSSTANVEASGSIMSLLNSGSLPSYAFFNLFSGCSKLVKAPNLPSTELATYCYANMFQGCTGLKTAPTLPSTKLAEYCYSNMFEGCTGITSIQWNVKNGIDFSLTSSSPYKNMSSITSVIFGDEVEHIPAYLCYGLTGLTSVTIPESVSTIGADAFEKCSSLANVNLGSKVTTIDHDAFYSCNALKSITLPSSLTTIGEYAFSECDALESIAIPDKVSSIEEGTFWNCSALKSVDFGKGVKTIGELAFGALTASGISLSITTLNIPDNITSIGKCAFYGCKKIRCVNFESTTPPEIGEFPFPQQYNDYANRSAVIKVPSGCLDKYYSSWGNQNWGKYYTYAAPYTVPLQLQDKKDSYWATLSSASYAIFVPSANAEVKTTAVSGGKLIMTNLTESSLFTGETETTGYWIPTSTGVLVNSAVSEVPCYLTLNKTVSALADNMLYPSNEDGSMPAPTTDGTTYYYYKLSDGSTGDKQDLGFYCGAGDGTAWEYKVADAAFLAVPQSLSNKRMSMLLSTKDLHISDAKGLTDFASSVNKGDDYLDYIVYLDNDIDMSGVTDFTPIGSNTYNYSGTFDGQGHRIKNLAITGESYTGLFGLVGGDNKTVNIKNVIIDSSCSNTSTGTAAAGLIGCVTSTSGTTCNVNIENCGNEAAVTADRNVGGILGGVFNNDNTVVTLNNCYNTGAITGRTLVSALGYVRKNYTITNCYNSGTLTATNNAPSLYRTDKTGGTTSVENCYDITGSQTGVTQITSANVASGELCFWLNGNRAAGTWGHTSEDSYPVLSGAGMQHYSRTMANQWGTICLPFAAQSGSDFDFYELSGVNNDALVLTKVDALAAGTPAIVRRSGDATGIDVNAVSGTNGVYPELVEWVDTPVTGSSANGLALTGTFSTAEITNEAGYIIANNAFWNIADVKGENKVYCAPFRAYIAGTVSGAKQLTIGFDDDIPTAIDDVLNLLNSSADGKYLRNGKLVIVKNGKQYSINGIEIK